MKTGSIHCPPSAQPLNLRATVEGGHTFCWQRDYGAGQMYDETATPSYVTVIPAIDSPTDKPEVVRVRKSGDSLRWQAMFDATETLTERLRLDDDVEEICATFPSDETITASVDTRTGLRLPNDPVFPTLIAFICSSQMRVERIHAMQLRLAEEFGEEVEFAGQTYYAFPTATQLAAVDTEELRDIKLGFRARYVSDTARAIAEEETDLQRPSQLAYPEAQTFLQQFMGVGEKVADCVLLYSCEHLSAVPIDTWIRQVLEEKYPELVGGSYRATSEAARDYFGPYAGYAQAYLFSSARQRP